MRRWCWIVVLAGGWLFAGPGCLGAIQREWEVLIAPEVSGQLFRDSVLFNSQLGRAFLRFWNFGA